MYVQTDEHAVHPKKGYSTYGAFDCKKCLKRGSLLTLLYKLGKIELLAGRRVDLNTDLTKLFIDEKVIEASKPLPTIEMPPMFERQFSNEYLNSRKLSRQHYREYCCGEVKYSMKHQDYAYIGLYQDSELKGYMGRYTGNDPSVKRYNNSRSSFGQILGGYDQVDSLTKTIILVEGFFDKVAVDRALGLQNKFDTRCLHLNGKSISDTQMMKLLTTEHAEHIIFAFDLEAASQIKALGGRASTFFRKVSAVTPSGNGDWGDISFEETKFLFENELKPIEEYQRSTIAIDFSKFRI